MKQPKNFTFLRTHSGVDPKRVNALFGFVYANAAGGGLRLAQATDYGAQEYKVKVNLLIIGSHYF